MNGNGETAGRLGTFAGVFTPSVLTIIGLILFLRLGFVVGESGLPVALLILLLANTISVLTSISLSAIATNLKVKRGGDYYLISRTLGPAWGGAIGIVMFLAQSVSIAFYCLGFGEVAAGFIPQHAWLDPQAIAAIALLVLSVFAWLGTDWATRFQYGVMAILSLALLAFFIGSVSHWRAETLAENWRLPGEGFSFWLMFALFFPAVTGFTQGVSMSGELKDAQRSLPLGTFLAVAVSIVIYFLAALAFAGAAPSRLLASDHNAMQSIALSGELIVAGVFAATLSSAMASFLGAPRILQSLASDRLFRLLQPFARTTRKSGNPRAGVLLSATIALLTIAAGQLDLIAPVVSMCFLVSYGLINFATYFESSAGSPSFRPGFRYFNRWLSLAGGLACLGAMLAIDWVAGVLAISLLLAVHQYLKHTAHLARWADGRRSYHLQQLREHLFAAEDSEPHPRDWRPNLLIFPSSTRPPPWLLQFAGWIIENSGFATAIQLTHSRSSFHPSLPHEAIEEPFVEALACQEQEIFHRLVFTPEGSNSIASIVQAFGIGPLTANTLLLDWPPVTPAEPDHPTLTALDLHTAMHLGCNIVLLSQSPGTSRPPAANGRGQTIDVWWWGDDSSRLELLLAYLVTRVERWEHATIRLLGVASETEREPVAAQLAALLDEARIAAEPMVVTAASEQQVVALSQSAALVFMPFKIQKQRPVSPFAADITTLAGQLPLTAWVCTAGEFKLYADPEEGRAGELALLLDTYEDHKRFVDMTARELAETEEKLADQRAALARLAMPAEDKAEADTDNEAEWVSAEPPPSSEQEKLAKSIERLTELQQKLFRRHARAQAKLKYAEQAARQAGLIEPAAETTEHPNTEE